MCEYVFAFMCLIVYLYVCLSVSKITVKVVDVGLSYWISAKISTQLHVCSPNNK